MSKKNDVLVTGKGDKKFLTDFFDKKKFLDGWSNILTGLNRKNKDARTYAMVKWQRPVEDALETLYAGDAMARKIVDRPIEQALEDGYTIVGITKDQEKLLKEKCKTVDFDSLIHMGLKKSRLYGGAAILKVYDDDLNLELPAPQGRPIKTLIILQRFELFSTWEDVDKNILSKNFGKPILYTLVGRSGSTAYVSNTRIHESRLVKFPGEWLPDRLRQSNGYWDDSVLTKVYDALRDYSEAHGGVSVALKDLSVAVMKIKDLADKISANEDGQVLKRLELVNMVKSMVGAVALDADGEEFTYQTRNLANADKLLEKVEAKLAADCGIPRCILLEESPRGGLGQSGNLELESWYNWLEAYQKNFIKPRQLEILKEFCIELGIDAKNLDIEYPSLYQMSEKELVETRNKQADTDNKYMEAGVLDPEEVRQSRFGGGKYSIETTIDKNLKPISRAVDEESGLVSGFRNDPNRQPSPKE